MGEQRFEMTHKREGVDIRWDAANAHLDDETIKQGQSHVTFIDQSEKGAQGAQPSCEPLQ